MRSFSFFSRESIYSEKPLGSFREARDLVCNGYKGISLLGFCSASFGYARHGLYRYIRLEVFFKKCTHGFMGSIWHIRGSFWDRRYRYVENRRRNLGQKMAYGKQGGNRQDSIRTVLIDRSRIGTSYRTIKDGYIQRGSLYFILSGSH